MPGLFDPILDLIGGKGGSDIQAPNIPLPVLQQMRPDLIQSAGTYNPEQEGVVKLGPSAMEGISTDPAFMAAQMNALQKLQSISDAGGRDAQLMAEAAQLQNDINANLRGNTGAIQQNLAARGFGGGMSEQVARQMAAQSAANRQAQMGLDLNAQAQQRALAALTSGAQLGGQMQAQQFGQRAQQAQAADVINQFNARNRQAVAGANVDRGNQAQQYNLGAAQQRNAQNTGILNQAQQYNLNLPQQQYENQMGQAQMQTGVQSANEARKEQRRSGSLGFAGGLLSAGAQAWGK